MNVDGGVIRNNDLVWTLNVIKNPDAIPINLDDSIMIINGRPISANDWRKYPVDSTMAAMITKITP